MFDLLLEADHNTWKVVFKLFLAFERGKKLCVYLLLGLIPSLNPLAKNVRRMEESRLE